MLLADLPVTMSVSPATCIAAGDYGTRMMKKTGNLKAVMKVMGHRDVKTAMKYQHPEIDIVRAGFQRFPKHFRGHR
jgi:site-specific recombinase XerC